MAEKNNMLPDEVPLIFISHASEDKDTFVRPLAHEMRKRGLNVWFDEFSLFPGSSLRESIDRGLARCRYGIVVLSPSFFAKRWTQWELNGLVQRHFAEERKDVIIPIWLNVDSGAVAKWSPSLADILAFRAERGIGEFVDFIASLCAPLPSNQETQADNYGEALGDILRLLQLSIAGIASINQGSIGCAIYVSDKSAPERVLLCAASTREINEENIRRPIRNSLTGLSFSQGRQVYVSNLGSLSSTSISSRALCLNSNLIRPMGGFIVAPILRRDSVPPSSIGVISVTFDQAISDWESDIRKTVEELVLASALVSAYVIARKV